MDDFLFNPKQNSRALILAYTVFKLLHNWDHGVRMAMSVCEREGNKMKNKMIERVQLCDNKM